MFVCKWCRESIRVASPSWHPHGIVWQHESGVFTCARRPELQAEPADTRWETVWASIDVSEFGHIRYEMVVQYFGKRVGIVHRASEFEFSQSYDPMMAERMSLDSMVEAMDKQMSRMPNGS